MISLILDTEICQIKLNDSFTLWCKYRHIFDNFYREDVSEAFSLSQTNENDINHFNFNFFPD